jgi:hypothetical protein
MNSRRRELNPHFNILTVVCNSCFRFELEDWADLKGIKATIYADDEELSWEWTGHQRGFSFA